MAEADLWGVGLLLDRGEGEGCTELLLLLLFVLVVELLLLSVVVLLVMLLFMVLLPSLLFPVIFPVQASVRSRRNVAAPSMCSSIGQ